MEKRKMLVFSAIVIVLAIVPSMFTLVQASELMKQFSVRITVVENNVVHEWEYDNPETYEYEKGNHVIRGEEAKVEVEKIMKVLDISEQAQVEAMIASLQKDYQDLQRLDIRWMNGKGELYTWVWDKGHPKSGE